ncbi:MAG: sensor histidine kinase [Candidatus Dormiibacterota bacterium]
MPLVADVDADRVQQLLVILADNAIRYSPRSSEVNLRCRSDERGLLLEVADRGQGIPAAQREHVFDRFTTTDASRTGAGAGLGLSIAHWIATSHGGAITLADNGPGLRVRVQLPRHTAEPSGTDRRLTSRGGWSRREGGRHPH